MLIVCDKYKFVYCQVPKSACSAIKKWILELNNDTKVNVLKGSKLLTYIHSYKYKTITPDEYLKNQKYKDYFLFTIVRNPYLRLVSAFKDRFIKAYINEPAIIWRKFAKSITKTEYLTFIQFVKNIQPSLKNIYTGNGHWRLQTILTHHKKLKYDMIIKMENLESEILNLYNRLDIPDNLRTVEVMNPTGNSKVISNAYNISTKNLNYKTDWSSFYNVEIINLVMRKYKLDFIAFGYSTELP